jgi:thiosulfate/3-mercaptopyruvate sulfurtransferase
VNPLVSPAELIEHAGADPGRYLLVDTRPRAAYDAGHLPGAIHLDLDRDLSAATAPGHDPARGGRHPLPSPEVFARTLGAAGITPTIHVVAYDAASGANAAARLWWMLRALGHDRVQVLDGGLPAVAALGSTTEVPAIVAAPPYPHHRWRLATVDADDVDARRTLPGWIVLDVRSAERFRGEQEPIDPIAGHIPGARNLPFADNLTAAGRYKPATELRAQYERFLGDVPVDHLIVHCGSGVTACHTLLALELAGLPGATLYVGSWGEWVRNPRLPLTPPRKNPAG